VHIGSRRSCPYEICLCILWLALKRDDLITKTQLSVPVHCNSSFDALMSRTAFWMYFEGAFGCFAGLRR
jgi:hypothetical protein